MGWAQPEVRAGRRKCRKYAGNVRRRSQGAWQAAEQDVPEAPGRPAPSRLLPQAGCQGAERARLRTPHAFQLSPLNHPVTLFRAPRWWVSRAAAHFASIGVAEAAELGLGPAACGMDLLQSLQSPRPRGRERREMRAPGMLTALRGAP